MALLPTASTLDDLGGVISDYDEIVDPTKDLPASADTESRANVAAMSRVVERLWFIWSNDGTVVTLVSLDSVVGSAMANNPTTNKQNTGHWRFTFPAVVVDALGNEQAWNFKRATGSALHSEPIHVQCKIVSPHIVDVYMWALPAATASDVTGVQFYVEVG